MNNQIMNSEKISTETPTSLSQPIVGIPTLSSTTLSPILLPTEISKLEITPMTNNLSSSCLQEMDPKEIDQVTQEGTLILDGPNLDIYFWNLQTQKKYPLIIDSQTTSRINLSDRSPDNRKVAYIEYHQDGSALLRVSDSQGNIQSRMVLPEGLEIISHWIDNENLLMSWMNSSEREIQNGNAVIINPFTQDQSEFQPSLPGIIDIENTDTFWDFVYSPDLKRVAYLRGLKEMVFWDIEKEDSIWQGEDETFPAQAPVWSPKGDELSFMYQGSIVRVNLDGKVSSIPGIENLYGDQTNNYFSWSADTQYIVFWRSKGGTSPFRMYLWNVSQDRVYDLCLEEAALAAPELTWSPTRHQFIMDHITRKSDGIHFNTQTILVDINDLQAIPLLLPEGTFPIEWLN